VSITIQSPYRAAGGVSLIGSKSGIQLWSPTVNAWYNWTTANATLSSQACWIASGPYLNVPASCLATGATYVFGLRVGDADVYGYTKVSRVRPIKNEPSVDAAIRVMLTFPTSDGFGNRKGGDPRRPAAHRRQLHSQPQPRQGPSHRLSAAMLGLGGWGRSGWSIVLYLPSSQGRWRPHRPRDTQLLGCHGKPYFNHACFYNLA
jgi:hypothetical protein